MVFVKNTSLPYDSVLHMHDYWFQLGNVTSKGGRGWHVQIVNKDGVQEAARETDGYFIKSGIVTIIKDAIIPHGTII